MKIKKHTFTNAQTGIKYTAYCDKVPYSQEWEVDLFHEQYDTYPVFQGIVGIAPDSQSAAAKAMEQYMARAKKNLG